MGALLLQNTSIVAETQAWVGCVGWASSPPQPESPTTPLEPCPFCRFVIQLLEDLVFFVSDVPNNGQNVLDIVVTKPNRERQKLMREQNILKQVSGPGAQQG